MKNIITIIWLAALVMLLLAACEKEETGEKSVDNLVEGFYSGTLAEKDFEGENGIVVNTIEATAEIKLTGESEIRIHCYSNDFDTTFMLNYYDHYDSAYVCLTGADFVEMYGHTTGNGHNMMGGMMGDIGDGETEWMHHMEDEHSQSDEHFGGFDMDDHTFSYIFRMRDRDYPYELIFQGSKH